MAKKTEPGMSASSMAAMIEKNELKNLYLFFGEDEFLKSYFSKCLIKRIGVSEESVKRFEGRIAAKDLREELGSSSLFASETVAVVTGSGLFKGSSASVAKDFAFLKELDEDSYVIFIEEEADRSNALYQMAESSGTVFDCSLRSLPEVVSSLTRRAGMNRTGITPGAIRLLYEGIGKDLYGLYNEVDRLALLVPGGVIDENLVLAESPLSIEAKIYDFTDAVVEKNFDKAMSLLGAMLRDKTPPQYIFASVAKHYEALYNVRCLMDERNTVSQIAEKLGLRDFIAKKYVKQCGAFDRNGLAEMIDTIAELDLSAKNGLMTPDTALEIVIGM